MVMPEALHESIERMEQRMDETLSRAEAAAYEEYDTEVSQAFLVLLALIGFFNGIALIFSLM